MCGIAGQIGPGTNLETVVGMTRALAHRGPDGEGFWSSECVALGHRRLSIIDIELGHQPMVSASGRWIIVFNGEIYNFTELRRTRYADYPYRTHSDTEVILAGLETEGATCLSELNGMFAFAAWDVHEQRLLLARDGQGIKPLYFTAGKRTLMFASEIRALLAAGAPRELAPSALDVFLDLRFVPAPRTFFRDTWKLLPGHYLTVRADATIDGPVPFGLQAPRIVRRQKASAVVEQLADALVSAVDRQMIADVPVGILLSGGVDSATVTAAARRTRSAVSTFCVGYEGKHWANEFDEARRTAELLGTDHQDLMISEQDAVAAMPRLIRHLEEPVVTTSLFSYYLLCERVRRHRKVVLTGQGADEPWGGYGRHRVVRLMPWLRILPPAVMTRALSVLFSKDDALRVSEVLAAKSEIDLWRALHSLFPGCQRRRIRSESTSGTASLLEQYAAYLPDNGTPFERLLAFEVRCSLPDNLLMLGDKLSMAHGLEVRVPLLDREYLRTVESLPGRLRLRLPFASGAKYLHKRVAATLLPREVVHRPKKGFQTPVESWMRGELGGVLRKMVDDQDSFTRRYLSLDTVRELIATHASGQRGNLERQLFAVWVLEEWHRAFGAAAEVPLRVPASSDAVPG